MNVADRTFTLADLDAFIIDSPQQPVRHGEGAFAYQASVAEEGQSKPARDVLGAAERRERRPEAARAVHAGLADRSLENRRGAIEALPALDET